MGGAVILQRYTYNRSGWPLTVPHHCHYRRCGARRSRRTSNVGCMDAILGRGPSRACCEVLDLESRRIFLGMVRVRGLGSWCWMMIWSLDMRAGHPHALRREAAAWLTGSQAHKRRCLRSPVMCDTGRRGARGRTGR